MVRVLTVASFFVSPEASVMVRVLTVAALCKSVNEVIFFSSLVSVLTEMEERANGDGSLLMM
jgi:hypothetical protein